MSAPSSASSTPLDSDVGARPLDPRVRTFVHDAVKSSRTSFYWAMRLLPTLRREGMFAFYAFCREVDDIADEPGELADKRAALAVWHDRVDALSNGARPQSDLETALQHTMQSFPIDVADLHGVVDGMEMDASGPIEAPTREELTRYCDLAASAVGRVSVCIFGQPDANGKAVANALGQALQLTNILRDLDEDAARGRVYLPRELLVMHGVPQGNASEVAAHPHLLRVCHDLAADALDYYDKAEAAIAACDRRAMRAPVIMMKVYRRKLARAIRDDFNRVPKPERTIFRRKLSKAKRKAEPLLIALKYGFR